MIVCMDYDSRQGVCTDHVVQCVVLVLGQRRRAQH